PGSTRLPSWSSLPQPIAGPPVPAGSEDQGENLSWPDRHQRLPRRCPDSNRPLPWTPRGPPASDRSRPGSLTSTLSRQPEAPPRRTGPPYASSAGWFLSPARPSRFLWPHPDRSTAASRDPKRQCQGGASGQAESPRGRPPLQQPQCSALAQGAFSSP